MADLLGGSPVSFVIITVVILGFAAFMTGQALANGWRPYWLLVLYCLPLAAAARFLDYGLAGGALLSIPGYVVSFAVLLLIASFAYRVTKARRMVSQYPWLYQRTGVFGWRARH